MKDIKEQYYSDDRVTEKYDYRRFKRGGGAFVAQKETRAVSELISRYNVSSPVILDCPTGTGRFVSLLNTLSSATICADISPSMIEIAKQYNASKYITCSADNIPVDDGSIDIWVMSRFCFHFEDLSPFFKEAQRILKPGGILVADMFHWSPRSILPKQFLGGKTYNHSKDHVMSVASTFDFTVEENIPLFFIPSYICGFLPLSVVSFIEKLSDLIAPHLKTKSYYLFVKNGVANHDK